MYTSQTHFGFTNIGSETYIFRFIAKRNLKFWFGSPCIRPLWNYPKIWELKMKAWRTFLVCITKDATKELPFILFFWQEIVEVKIGLKMHVDYNCFKTAFVVLKRHCYFFPRFADFCGRGDVWVKTPSCAFFKAFIGDGWTLLHLKSRWRFATRNGKKHP